jgi:hypothetical protein
MRRTLLCCLFLMLGLILSGCGGGHSAATVTPSLLATIGQNLSIGPLLMDYAKISPEAIAEKAAICDGYLTRMLQAGYAPLVRVPFDRGWGPQLLLWLPALLRRRGFKLLAILSGGIQAMAPPKTREEIVAYLNTATAADVTWLHSCLPQIADILCGAETCNEPWNPAIDTNLLVVFPPDLYVAWHNEMAAIVRQHAPGVPILASGGIQDGASVVWWQQVLAAGPVDADVVSLHLYGNAVPPVDRQAWVTEADLPTRPYPPGGKFFLFQPGFFA